MYNRRKFIKNSTVAAAGLGMAQKLYPLGGFNKIVSRKKIGVIGLDTVHPVEFAKEINLNKPDYAADYKITTAYPKGSLDIDSAIAMLDENIEEVKKAGVEIVDSISEVVDEVDVVLLETNDGRRHLEQVLPVFKAGKPVFIDKPIAGSLVDAIVILKLAEHYDVPVFSSSALRYMKEVQKVKNDNAIGEVLGADTYSPGSLEETHPDLFWYGIHGVEPLFALMGTGCKELKRTYTKDTDVVVGVWEDGRIGTFRGTRSGQLDFGGTAYGENGNVTLGSFEGYIPLLKEIISFFDSGELPVSYKEIIEIFTFMEAADQSKMIEGGKINLQEVKNKALRKANGKLKKLI